MCFYKLKFTLIYLYIRFTDQKKTPHHATSFREIVAVNLATNSRRLAKPLLPAAATRWPRPPRAGSSQRRSRPLPAGRGHPAPAPRSAGPTLLAHADKRTAAACFSLESASDWGRAAPRAHARPGMEPAATRIPTLEAGGDAGCGLGQWGCAGPQRGPRPASSDAAPDQTKYNVGRAGSS